jgi:hypothetical protein
LTYGTFNLFHILANLPVALARPVVDAFRYYFPFPRRRKVRSLLLEANETYRRLPARKRFAFENRVIRFVDGFEFLPREPFKEINLEMQVILGGQAARMMLFLPEQCFDYYHTIIIYPTKYLSTYTTKYHNGEVNPGARLMVFAWDAVLKGLKLEDDGLNLLLHEYAHALWLENRLMSGQYEVFDDEAMTLFDAVAESELEHVRSNEQHFLRKYAAGSHEEFFAVAVESFFERPAIFREQLPRLYDALKALFRQDPLTLQR